MNNRICLVAAAATFAVNGRFLEQMPGDGLGAGPSAIAEALRAARERATGHVWEGVARVEDLESQNADLWRRNKELENRAAAAAEDVEQLEESSATKQRERVLGQELTDLKSKEAALEADKSALATSMAKIMKTNETAALDQRLADANTAKLAEEKALVHEQQDLKAQIQNATQKLRDASKDAESLQQDNFEMHKASEAMQGQIQDLRSLVSSTRAQKEHLEESMKSTWKTASAKERDDLQADESDLRQKANDARQTTQRLQKELQDVKQRLSSKGDAPKMDGGAEILQTLQDENLDLRRESDASRSEVTALKDRLGSLQYDKEHLIATMQSSMHEADKLKQLLKTTIAEKDKQVADKDKQLLEGARQLASLTAKSADKAHPTAPYPASGSVASQHVAPQASTKPDVRPRVRAAAEDPILSMHSHVEQERKERERMQEFARAAVAATGDESLAFGTLSLPGASTEPVAAAKAAASQPSAVSRAPKAHELSPVDALDPEAVAKEQQAAKVDDDAAQGDNIERLLTQAQSAVDSPLAAQ